MWTGLFLAIESQRVLVTQMLLAVGQRGWVVVGPGEPGLEGTYPTLASGGMGPAQSPSGWDENVHLGFSGAIQRLFVTLK